MFIDETEIVVSSGRGGAGLVSFRREKYVPRGGPDGGDGGRGGDVILRAVGRLNTLAGIQHARHYRAENGSPGGTANRHGANGEDLVLEVPVGTLVRDAERGHVLRDLRHEGDEVVIAGGGTGGKGNKHFANATNRAPRESTPGRPSESRRLRLELRLVADVGLVGLPNAGKSTFLSRISAARPKVADYPFTTLKPVLGRVEGDDLGLIVADIPGLIEGAHEGAGLGDRFLRHVARTRVLLHLVDGTEGPEAACRAWTTVRQELALSGLGMETKLELIAVSKLDAVADPDAVIAALARASGADVLGLSSATGAGVHEILGRLRRMVEDLTPAGKMPPAPPSKTRPPVEPASPPLHPDPPVA